MTAINETYKLGLNDELIKSIIKECRVCIDSKAKRAPIGGDATAAPSRIATSRMDCWHVDLTGPYSLVEGGERFRAPALDGSLYSLTIVDEFTRFKIITPIKAKSDVASILIDTIKLFQNQTGLPLKRVHGDGGGEFINKTLKKFLLDNGTELTTSVPRTPQLNGTAERHNGLADMRSRCMLVHCSGPPHLWSLARVYGAHIENRIPGQTRKIPMSVMEPNRKIRVAKIHTFGCDAFVLNQESELSKIQGQTSAGIFVGHCPQYNAFRILMASDLSIRTSRDVQFLESSFQHLKDAYVRIVAQAERISTKEGAEYEVELIQGHKVEEGVERYLVKWKGWQEPTWERTENLTNCSKAIDDFERRNANRARPSKRKRSQAPQRPHSRLDILAYVMSEGLCLGATEISPIDTHEPRSYSEALAGIDAPQWKEAINTELESIDRFGVFEEVELPPGRKAIDTRWVFKHKLNSKSEIIRHRARLVVRGFLQKLGIDYDETFAPTVRMKTLKALLAIAARDNLEIKQCDFETAFLNGDLEEEIYIKPPEGYKPLKPGMVLKLKKTLYGIKQAPRGWWLALGRVLRSLGYTTGEDPCLFEKAVGKHKIYIPVYVDDLLAIYPIKLEHVWLADKAKLAEHFPIKDLGDCSWLLNMAVTRDRARRIIQLSQETYTRKVVERFPLPPLQTRAAHTPYWADDLTVCPKNFESSDISQGEIETYRSIVGSLLYAANITRMDIAHITSVLARYLQAPKNYHLIAAYRVLNYISQYPSIALKFGPNHLNPPGSPHSIAIYSDSDYASERDDCISVGGYATCINGSLVSWESKKQTTRARSSTEAELSALDAAVREAEYQRKWFECYMDQAPVVALLGDNTSSLEIADHETNHGKTKHIRIRDLCIRDAIANGTVKTYHVASKENIADILTKATKREIFDALKHFMFEVNEPLSRILKNGLD